MTCASHGARAIRRQPWLLLARFTQALEALMQQRDRFDFLLIETTGEAGAAGGGSRHRLRGSQGGVEDQSFWLGQGFITFSLPHTHALTPSALPS